MESYLKKYKFVFNTVGPVFVGSGQNLKKRSTSSMRKRAE